MGIPGLWAPPEPTTAVGVLQPSGKSSSRRSSRLLRSLPSYNHIEGLYTQHSLSSTTKPLGIALGIGSPPGSDAPMEEDTFPGGDISLGNDVPMEECTLLGGNTPLQSDVHPSPSAARHVQAIRDPMVIPASNILLPEKVLLEAAMRCLDCSLGAVAISQDSPSSVPMSREPTIPHHRISSLQLPEKMLSADYNIPKTSKATLSMEFFSTTRMQPKDPW